MRVRVKDGKTGFIYGVYRTEGTEFDLEPVERDEGVFSVEDQFSEIWMEKVRGKPGPKTKRTTED